MPWFQEFAGLAFTWQDDESLEAAVRTTPIFSLVPAGEADQQSQDVVEFTLDGG
jgi:hypothetical protein